MTEEKVTIAGEEYPIQRFRGLKAILVIAALTRIARDIPDIIADVTKDYYKRNTTIVTEAMSKLPRWEGFSKEDFDDAEKRTGLRQVELPTPISEREQTLAALPQLLEGTGRREVIRLFAILVVPNAELAAADKADRVNETLDKYSDLFLYEAELEELIDVVIASQHVISQLEDTKRERLGEMMASLLGMINPTWAAAFQKSRVSSSTPQTSSGAVPISPTDSPQHTDGREKSLSMASPGTS
jgi:hypothetical protein